MTMRWTIAVIACAMLLTGCSQSPAPSGEGSSPTPSTDATTSSGIYTDQQLVAALPRTMKQLHGVKLRTECLTMRKACPPNPSPGFVFVDGSNSGPNNIGVAVQVLRRWDDPAWADTVEDCPQGSYRRPLEWTPKFGKGSYRPGEQGRSARTNWAVDSWTGFTCKKNLVRLWPEGEQSERGTTTYAYLNNGHHTLRVEGRTLAETKALATEYLRRLEENPGA